MNSNSLFPLFTSFLISPMKDTTIIELFFNRDENAIRETDKKYGKYCFSIANRILFNRSDSDECVNDTYFKAWTTIPPTLPENLKIYLGKITRNIALNLYEKLHASKRADSQMPVILDEISEMIGENKVEQEINAFLLTDSINSVSLNTAEQMTGFKLEIPDIFDTTTKIYVIDQMIEVQYCDTEDNIIYKVRKAKSNDDCSGDYEVYQNEKTKEIQNQTVTLKGTVDIYYLAIWQNDEYSYSFYSYNGLDENTITTYIEKIR